MKRIFAAALLVVTAFPAFCQNVQDAGYGLYGGSWVPLYASASGASGTDISTITVQAEARAISGVGGYTQAQFSIFEIWIQ
jgi:hypothetical protein